ncbi:hypothetical protein HAX54_023601, partial [Datura stramonium]|nr:hypothetical protein [Datura stramonium]
LSEKKSEFYRRKTACQCVIRDNGVASGAAKENAQTWISKSENKEKVDDQDEKKRIGQTI